MNRFGPLRSRRLASIVSGLFLSGSLSACFSEHVDSTEPPGADCVVPASAQGPGKAVVRVRGYRFSPDTLRVAANTQVSWFNCDDLAGARDPHTTTSDNGLWNAPLALNQLFSRTFDRNGNFPYYCIPHPAMRAVIIVQ